MSSAQRAPRHAGAQPGVGGFVSQMLVYALVMICGGGGVGLGTVWLRQKISVAANKGKVMESTLADLKRQVDAVESDIVTQEQAGTLKHRNELWKLGLVPPQEAQIERVGDSPVILLAKKRGGIFADSGLSAVGFAEAGARSSSLLLTNTR